MEMLAKNLGAKKVKTEYIKLTVAVTEIKMILV